MHTSTPMGGKTHVTFAAAVAMITVLSAAHAAWTASYRYYAVMDGKCEDLVVAENKLNRTCVDKLVNVDFGDGRVSFTFGAATDKGLVTTEFNGGESFQLSRRSYILYVDALITTYAADRSDRRIVSEPVKGVCTMDGDPTTERAVFKCWAGNEKAQTSALFRSQGRPLVDHGKAGDGTQRSG